MTDKKNLCPNCKKRPRYNESGWCLECQLSQTQDVRTARKQALDMIDACINAVEGTYIHRSPTEIADYVRAKLFEKGITLGRTTTVTGQQQTDDVGGTDKPRNKSGATVRKDATTPKRTTGNGKSGTKQTRPSAKTR